MSWRTTIERFRRNPDSNEYRGWWPFGWAFGRTYEGKVLQGMPGDEAAVAATHDQAPEVCREVFREERELRQQAVRWVKQERDREVLEAYWGPRTNEHTVVKAWRDNGYEWGQVAPIRLPKRNDTWDWWVGQNEPGVVALPAKNWEKPIVVGSGSHVLVVTDNRNIERNLTGGAGGHILGDRLRDMLASEVTNHGLLNVITVAEFDRWITDHDNRDILGSFSHVLVGATRDLDTPTRLARTWCLVCGWSEGRVDQVAEAWLGVTDHTKLVLDLASLENYWVGME